LIGSTTSGIARDAVGPRRAAGDLRGRPCSESPARLGREAGDRRLGSGRFDSGMVPAG
jgi:hypothetical protein